MNLSELKLYLASLDISPLKRFSQNFLHDQNILDKVIKTADIQKGDRVLEIGPGAGMITHRLLEEGALVTAVEIDRTFAQELRKLPLELIEGDFLKIKLPDCDKVVSNLPYHLTSPIMARILPVYQSCTLFCQEEMAKRITAKPNCKEYGSFTVFVQFYAEAKYAFKVSKNCFYPVPKVDSAVVHFTKKEPPAVDPEKFFDFVHTAFQGRRKMVATTWRKKYNLIGKTDARPENLTLEEFLYFYEKIPQADRK